MASIQPPQIPALYVVGNVSADSFIGRMPIFEGDALKEIKKIKGKDGKIDHATLPGFAKVEKEYPICEKQNVTEEVFDEELNETVEVIVEKDVQIGIENVIERSIGNMVSMKAKAIQELGQRLEVLENGHRSLSGT